MANLCKLFRAAESQFKLRRETSKKRTMEVLKYEGRGVAWRWINRGMIQLCPPTKGRKTFRDGQYLVIQGKGKECRYRDPRSRLNPETWSYAGCDCTHLSDEQVWKWIETACKYQKG
jgi:hypothetical protein